MAGRFLGGQSLGKSAIFKSLATPANPGADADPACGPDGLARHQFSANCSQPTQGKITQSVAKKLPATGVGLWKRPFHNSATSLSFRHPLTTGLPSFGQPLAFLALLP
jgi:hypothetical protein